MQPHYLEVTGHVVAQPEDLNQADQYVSLFSELIDKRYQILGCKPNSQLSRIGLVGFSLGGGLALKLASEDSRIQSVVEYSESHEFAKRFRNDCPVLIVHGGLDKSVPVHFAHGLKRRLLAQHIPFQP